jgi:hypothetical protein
MYINNLKKFIKKITLFYNFFIWFKDRLIILSRLKDVIFMMIMFHVWPEKIYRFSTRKVLPKKFCVKNILNVLYYPMSMFNLICCGWVCW